MTNEEFNEKLKRLSENPETIEFMEIIGELQKERTESPTPSEPPVVAQTDGINWKEKYSALEQTYKNRFFAPSESQTVMNQSQLIESETKPESFDDLFK